jgi:predicted dehydrogenase
MKRKQFLETVLGASAFASIPFSSIANDPLAARQMLKEVEKSTSGSMVGFRAAPIEKVLIGIIGMGNRGQSLLEMLQLNIENGSVEIVAFSDINEAKAAKAVEILAQWQKKKPMLFTKGERDWEHMVKMDELDLVLVTTPWEWHTEMALFAMNNGKHAATEVPIAYSMSDCWEIIATAERTKKHCIMLENCCYNEEELFVMQMIEDGVFGDITHCEGAYLHDLRAHMLSDDYYEDQWRIMHHVARDGNLYPTHGLGPISFYLGIGHGDRFEYLTSMSSRELNLSQTAERLGKDFGKIVCGDMNSTMLRTYKGKTVLLQFDTHTGRPYSRINKVVGTKAVHDGYPSRLFIDSEEPVFWGHKWLEAEEYSRYKAKHTHPVISRLKDISMSFKQGHGGMDFIMMFRLIECLNKGLPLDINVYESVIWSSVTPLSVLSVASDSLPLPFPKFMGENWKSKSGKWAVK